MSNKEQQIVEWGIWPSRKSFILSTIVMGVLLGFFHEWFEILIEKPPDFFQSFLSGFPIKVLESFLKLVPLLLPFYLLLNPMRRWPFWRRAVLFVVLAMASTILEELVSYYIPGLNLHKFDTESSLFLVLLSFDMLGDILVFLLILSGLGYMDYMLYRNHTLFMNLAEEKAKVAEEERLRLIADLKVLQAQVNPHFLFNTLNSLAALVVTNADKAETLIKDMSDWYRNILISTHQSLWRIQDEIEMIHNYLKIESVRLGERLVYDIQCSDEAMKIEIPPLILQPLVENAVKHAIAPSISGGMIAVEISGNQRSFRIKVVDRRKGNDYLTGNHKNLGTGSGIENIKKRLLLAFSGRARFSLQLHDDGGVAEITVDLEEN